MTPHTVTAILRRAVEVSHELAAIADNGDVLLTQRLDAERLQLLKSVKMAAEPLDELDRSLLREITELNDKAIGYLEHRRRCKARDMDTVAIGRRAVNAYAGNGRY
jgi:hypothetical protein